MVKGIRFSCLANVRSLDLHLLCKETSWSWPVLVLGRLDFSRDLYSSKVSWSSLSCRYHWRVSKQSSFNPWVMRYTGESLLTMKTKMTMPMVGKNDPIKAVICQEQKLPMMYAMGMPAVAAIAAELIMAPRISVVLISEKGNVMQTLILESRIKIA